ncbi:MAG: helix-turn-helix domain-containing protein [Terriglobia bacterium]
MFNGKRIRQVRELRGWTQNELARRAGVSQGAIAQLEGGFKDASQGLIESIATQTRFPISFFASQPAAEFSLNILLFRAHASMTRREAVQAARYSEIMYELALALWSRIELKTPSFPRSPRNPEAAAREIRRLLNLPATEPIPHVINVVERCSILVLALPTNSARQDAFSLWSNGDQKNPIICISECKAGDRLRLSVAHELGHLVLMHHGSASGDFEREAYRFSAELLMPADAIRREMPSPLTLSGVAELKPRWRVSIQALIRRAFDLQLISNRQYRYLFEQLSIKGWRTKEPSNLDIPVERPRGLRQMAELTYGNPIDYDRFSADVHIHPELLREIMRRFAESESRHSPESIAASKVVLLHKRHAGA